MSLAFPSGGEEIRRQLCAEVADRPFPDAAERALELGTDYLNTEVGLVARIDAEEDRWEVVVSTDPADGVFPSGRTEDLKSTYCRWAIKHDYPVALHDTLELGWGDEPTTEVFDLRCYHGAAIEVDDGIYGAVCFVSETPRPGPFEAEETAFVELVSRLLGEKLDSGVGSGGSE